MGYYDPRYTVAARDAPEAVLYRLGHDIALRALRRELRVARIQPNDHEIMSGRLSALGAHLRAGSPRRSEITAMTTAHWDHHVPGGEACHAVVGWALEMDLDEGEPQNEARLSLGHVAGQHPMCLPYVDFVHDNEEGWQARRVAWLLSRFTAAPDALWKTPESEAPEGAGIDFDPRTALESVVLKERRRPFDEREGFLVQLLFDNHDGTFGAHLPALHLDVMIEGPRPLPATLPTARVTEDQATLPFTLSR